jgi:hypothetical protein
MIVNTVKSVPKLAEMLLLSIRRFPLSVLLDNFQFGLLQSIALALIFTCANSWSFSMKMRLCFAAIAVGIVSFSTLAIAQDSPDGGDKSMMHGEMNKPSNMDMSMMKDLGPSDKNYDLRFIDAMLPHHEGAVMMAKDALQKSNRPEIQKLAKNIISSQEKEIAQMKALRKAWYQK